MNISNALFEFTTALIEAAEEGDALFEKEVHADIYEEIKMDTIRIDDLRAATPVVIGSAVRKDNAVISLMFVAFPDSQKLSDRLAARQRAEDMADAWFLAMDADRKLGNRVCLIGKITQFNDWIKPGTVKMPVCVLRMEVNPRR